MKQIFLHKGNIVIHNIPEPTVRNGCVLVKTYFSCISAGTEMASVADSSKSLIKKALEKPKTVMKVLNTGMTRGIGTMLGMIQGNTFGSPIGYTAAGTVIESKDTHGCFSPNQRVAVMGTNYANHAEINIVPENLVVPIPDSVSLEDAATAALGGIAMQGVRQLEPKINDTVVVMGLGFLGQITAQILVAFGCNVIGIDINREREEFAKREYNIQTLNGKDPMIAEKVYMITGGKGADGVIFTAATHSSNPMSNCFKMLRKKGTFVLVGVSGMTINRDDIYKKEISFKISTSYGPGRYDTSYEEKGYDYPYEYVRFTEKRNVESYFDLIKSGMIKLSSMSKQVYALEDASKAFDRLKQEKPPMISLIEYNKETSKCERKTVINSFSTKNGVLPVGFIGAGDYAKNMHLPNIKRLDKNYVVKGIMNRSAIPAAALAHKFSAAYFTVDHNDILKDNDITLVFICTRHDSHAKYVIDVLNSGKNVFVEKPLALNESELNDISKALTFSRKKLFVGYNRRFSKYTNEIKRVCKEINEPIHIEYTMNAGYIPYDIWVHNSIGGGRIIGEGCHIVDLVSYIIDSKPIHLTVMPLQSINPYLRSEDNVSFVMEYENGSTALIHYFSCGAKDYSKETMTVICGDVVIDLDNYESISAKGASIKNIKSAEPDKGQLDILKAVYDNVTKDSESLLIPFEDLYTTSRITFMVAEACRSMKTISSKITW